MRRHVIGALAVLFSAGCAAVPRAGSTKTYEGPLPATPGEAAAATAEIGAALERYAAFTRALASDSIAAMFTADGEMLQPGMTALRGPAGVLGFLRPLEQQATVESATMTATSLTVAGHSAMQWGDYYEVVTPRGQPRGEFRGRFAIEWRREGDGQWRIVRLIVQPAPRAPS
jgi:ketosteroid isomerase-like protein